MTIRFDNKVIIVTGAGNGLGRAHALEFARRGARVVVNDLGSALDGSGGSSAAAQAVVSEIETAGGQAIANGANVADVAQVDAMVAQTMERWGRVDVLINNAGILRDKTFAKMDMRDFETVVAVHLQGSANCARAVWNIMREQNYGRIVMTTSSSGLYGNFGQANYGAAKFGVVGLMNVLHLEGSKYNIRVNAVAPCAGTRMLENIMPAQMLALLDPAAVTPAVIFLACDDAPSRTILDAGAGTFSVTRIYETQGMYLSADQCNAEGIAANWAAISDPDGQQELQAGSEQTQKILARAVQAAEKNT